MTGRVIAVSGVASGIGAAARRMLEASGDRVIGIDLRDAEVLADLATPDGRVDAVRAVADAAGGRLDAAVLCAGVRGRQVGVVSVNYFGTVHLLTGLRPLLARGAAPAAVAVASYALVRGARAQPIVSACLDGDEAGARRLVAVHDEAYAAGKLALARWVRSRAVAPEWAGAGITLNAVAPGIVVTPMVAGLLADPVAEADLRRRVPMPLGRHAQPDEIAAVLAFLVSEHARMICGQVLFVDGGAEAVTRRGAVGAPTAAP